MLASERSDTSRTMRTTTKPMIHQRARWRRRGEGSAGQVAGDAHGGSLTSASQGPTAQASPVATARECPGQSLVGRHEAAAARVGRRVGVAGRERLARAHRAGQRVVLAVRAPASAEVTTQRNFRSAPAAVTPAENACVA